MKPHLMFYEKYAAVGTMPFFGLCSAAGDGYISHELLDLMRPTDEDEVILVAQYLSTMYWGSGLSVNNYHKYQSFTPLRQTIVLFMAAMAGEL